MLRVYADTSVFGGAFDEDFDEASGLFIEAIRRGSFKFVVSDVVPCEHFFLGGVPAMRGARPGTSVSQVDGVSMLAADVPNPFSHSLGASSLHASES